MSLTLPELKNYLRYEEEDTSQDSALGNVLNGAIRWVENYTGHILSQRIVRETPRVLGAWYDLRRRPYEAGSLTISVLDSDYAANDEFAGFVVYDIDGVARVQPTSVWPTTYGGYTFSYLAGYEDSYGAPDDLMLGVLLHAGMTDEQRGDQSSQGWKSLYSQLEQYRMPVLA